MGIAQKKFSTQDAAKNLELLLNDQHHLTQDIAIKKQINLVTNSLYKENIAPIIASHKLYIDMWELAVMVEEGNAYLEKKNLEQVEQNLFDSINQKDTEKIGANIEKFKESMQTILNMEKNNSEYTKNLNEKRNKNLTNQFDQLSEEIKDLLNFGSKDRANDKIQELRELSDSLKNKNNFDNKDMLEQASKEEFINKLSELLNEQEKVMEESFNMAANRGKFEQSSEGSGGKSPKEKQENLRNTLGNIMREIGASENEIPQELGRADRAMRQASRDLENGRPDRASNAQGRALEMIQRSMNRLNSKEPSLNAEYNRSGEEEINSKENNNITGTEENMNYSGTLSGGILDISKSNRVRKSKIIADELYSRYNQKSRNIDEKQYIKDLLDWY